MLEPFEPALLDVLENASTNPWEGLAWRQVVKGGDPVQPNIQGARWNPPGVEALYCALSPEGASSEIAHVLSRQPVPVRKPLSMVQLKVRLSQVAVIVVSREFESIGITAGAVTGDDWSLPQRIGAAADWLGLGGLLVPSARHKDQNLVIFVNHLEAVDFFEVIMTP